MRDDRDFATREAERRMVGLGRDMAASVTGLIIASMALLADLIVRSRGDV